MTAALLPVKISGRRYGAGAIKLVDRKGNHFCIVPLDADDTAMARAELIRDAMNEME